MPGAKKIIRSLSNEDTVIIRDMYRQVMRRPRNRIRNPEETPELYTPDVYMVKIPSGGIPARTGTGTDIDPYILGKGVDCQVFRTEFDTDPEIDEYTMVEVTDFLIDVYNPYPVKWYVGPKKVYIRVQREKYGRFICEKPQMYHLFKPTVNVEPGQTKPAKLIIGGVEKDTLDVELSWAHGGQKISANKETFASFYENEEKWRYTGADCETT